MRPCPPFDSLNKEVQTAAKSNLSGHMLDTLERVMKELPRLSARLQSIKPKAAEEKNICALFQEGLNSYMQACEFYKDSLMLDDTEHARRARIYMNDAGKLLKEAVDLLRKLSQ